MPVHALLDGDEIEVWTDCEPGQTYTGRCLGSAPTFEEAKRLAIEELRDDIAALERLQESAVIDYARVIRESGL